MRLIHELKRRHVFRVATGYIALSWLAIQIAETVLPAFGLADAVRMVVLVAVIGFIPVLAFAWVFELTPEGFKLDREVNRDSEAVRRLDKRLDRVAIVFLALALGYFAFDKFVLDPARDAAFRKALLGEAAGRDDSASRLGDAVLVTDFPGSHTQPTLSPDGGRMAFVSPDGNNVMQIWVMSLPNGEPVQVTRGELPATSPSWSPVDDNILFQQASDEEGQGIWLVDAQGTRTPRLLVRRGWSPRFAPDGRSFVFVPGPMEIAIGYLDGSEPRLLEGIPQTPGFAEPMPAVNGNGDVVFVLADESPIGNLWLFEAASGAFRQITTSVNEWPGVGAEGPVWLPDGRTVLYAAPDGEFTNYHLWQFDTSGGNPVMLTAGSGGYGYPAISGDGSRLAYAHSRPVWRLVATDPATGQDRVLYQTRNPMALPLVSPDGESVVYFAEDGVFTVPVAGGKAEQRTFGPTAEATLPTWSRNDGSIWYYKGRSLHRLDPETGLSQEVLADFHWSKQNWLAVHGNRIAYNLKGSRRTEVLDLSSGEKRSLETHVLPADWSRDGSRLLSRGTRGAGLMICSGPELDCEPILDDSGSPVLGAIPRWSTGESRVFYRDASHTRPGYAEIWSVAAEGGEPRLEAEVGPYDASGMLFGIAEGDVIVWNGYEPAGISEIWMTEAPEVR